jgi:DHA1 family solute carrier family 18 vesicular amine transporter 1/2
LLGAPLGGILYGKFGFHGPFIFGIIITFIDLVGRFLVLEQKDVAPFLQADATALVPLAVGGPAPAFSVKFDASATPTSPLKKRRMSIAEPDAEAPRAGHARTYDSVASIAAFAPEPPREPLPFMRVLVMLLTSPRALAAIANTLIVQMAFTATDPTLPLYLQDVFHLNAAKVGLVSLSAVVPAFICKSLARLRRGQWRLIARQRRRSLVTCVTVSALNFCALEPALTHTRRLRSSYVRSHCGCWSC